MKLNEFKIGMVFYTNQGCFKWRCTDVGTRTIVAIRIDDQPDESWYNGPPYAVLEHVMDEHSLPSCTRRTRRKKSQEEKK